MSLRWPVLLGPAGRRCAAWICLAIAGVCGPFVADVGQASQPEPGPVIMEREPVALDRVWPDYPQSGRSLGLRGRVLVHVRVDRTGAVDSAVVGRGFSAEDSMLRAAFDSAAVRAARQWRFQPATAARKPVRTWIAVPFRFEPPGGCRESQHQPFPADDKRPIVDRNPEAVRMVPPEYPTTTGKDRVDGTVLLHALICEHGRVVKAVVVKSEAPILNEAAVTAMLKCIYRPAEKEGRPIATWIDVPFRFTIH